MKTSFGKWAVCASLFCAGVAIADEKEADDCLRSKIWSGYDEGWAVRTATTTTLKSEEHRVYLVTLYEGNEYKISVCGDKNIANVDVVLHNANGDELKRAKAHHNRLSFTRLPRRTLIMWLFMLLNLLKVEAGPV